MGEMEGARKPLYKCRPFAILPYIVILITLVPYLQRAVMLSLYQRGV